MKRVALIAILVGNAATLPIVLSTAASGHAANDFYDPPHKYAINQDVYYNIDASLSLDTAKDAVRDTDLRWSDRVNGRAPDFLFASDADLSNPFSPCGGPNAVFRDYMGPENGFADNTLGYTPGCWQDGKQTGFTMVLNSRYVFNWSTNPPDTGEADGRSILTHEWGHATGWYGHMENTSGYCSGSGPVQTMCRSWQGGMGWRTLEDHDTHTIQNAYE